MNIGFHSNKLTERGTEVALFDYAYFHQKRGYKSFIFFNGIVCMEVYEKFKKEFTCISYKEFSELDQLILDNKIDYLE